MSPHIHTSPTESSAIDPSWFRGARISGISSAAAGVWLFRFDSGTSLAVECLWRLLVARAIVVTSEDHGQRFGLEVAVDAGSGASEVLARDTVKEFSLRADTLDLIFTFDRDQRLEILPSSSGYESWHIISPQRRHIIAQGGGQLCAYSE
jgi:hypothetical protein